MVRVEYEILQDGLRLPGVQIPRLLLVHHSTEVLTIRVSIQVPLSTRDYLVLNELKDIVDVVEFHYETLGVLELICYTQGKMNRGERIGKDMLPSNIRCENYSWEYK